MDRMPSTVSSDTSETKNRINRAVRHALQLPLRFRVEGEQEWTPGETLNLSESGVLFSSDQMLEVNTKVEITFQTKGAPMLQTSTRLAEVVRRVLSNWPETRPVFGAKFRS